MFLALPVLQDQSRCHAQVFALEIVKLLCQSENPTDDALDMPEGIAAELAGFADLHEPTLRDVFPSVLEPLLAADEFQMIFPNVLIYLVG